MQFRTFSCVIFFVGYFFYVLQVISIYEQQKAARLSLTAFFALLNVVADLFNSVSVNSVSVNNIGVNSSCVLSRSLSCFVTT